MNYRLQYLDEVLTDVEKAIKWYAEQRKGLENEFSEAIEKAIEQVLKMPNAFDVRYKNVRIAHPKRFPYNIHFYVDETNTSVVITAIVHGKRDVAPAKKRIAKRSK